MLAPMRPSPIIPSCITDSFAELIVRRVRFRSPNGRSRQRGLTGRVSRWVWPFCRSRVGRFENALNGRVQLGVALGIGLLGRQSLDQRPRKARHDALIPAQAFVALFLGIATRQRNHPHDLGMADEVRVEIVLFRQGELEHDQLTRRQSLELFEDGRLEQLFGLGFSGQWMSTSGSTIGTRSAAMICRAISNCWATMS